MIVADEHTLNLLIQENFPSTAWNTIFPDKSGDDEISLAEARDRLVGSRCACGPR
jgi:hypothetical protein